MSNVNMHNGGDKHGTTFDIFVGALKSDKTEEWVREYFSQYGAVESTSFRAGTKDDGKNTVFVRFKDMMAGVRAIENNVRVDWCKVSCGSRSSSWYDNYKRSSDRGEKRTHEGHKSDRGPPGHVHRQPAVASDKSSTHKIGDIIRKEEIMLSYHETPLVFWGQSVDRSTELQDLSDQLQVVCPGGQSLTGTPNMDKIYATMFSLDGLWYRCRISKIVSDVEVQVTFIDFGNSEVKKISEVKDLLANLVLNRPLAQRYCLYGLRLLHSDKDSIEFAQGCRKLIELTDNNTLVAHVCHSNMRGMIPVILESANVDVNQEMLNCKFAEAVKIKSHTHGHAGQGHFAQDAIFQGHQHPLSHPPAPLMSGVGHVNSLPVGKWIQCNSENATQNRAYPVGGAPLSPPSSQLPNQNDLASSGQHRHGGAGGDPWAVGGGPSKAPLAGPEVGRLQHAANMAQQETHQMALKLHAIQEAAIADAAVLKRQWDATTLELGTTKTNLRTLREDYTALVKDRTERSLSQRLARLVLSVERVKGYRIQFPTEAQDKDPIEQAFNVASDTRKITTSQLPVSKVVERTHSIYRTTMNAIRGAGNAEGLNDLIAARDQSRKDLYEALTLFINTTTQLPLSERSQQVEHMLELLAKTYKAFLWKDSPLIEDITTFDQAIGTYREWKSQKMTEFSEARTRTNTCHNGINNALRTLQQQLSLDSMSETTVTTCGSLDQLLDGLQEAVDEEASKTNLVSDVNEADTAIVTTLLHVVDTELRRELVDIVHLRRLLAENTSLLADIEPWLTQKLSLDRIMAVRKNIKACKSKLRHKLADLQDLEEELDGGDSEELRTLREELAAIRFQLHTTFVQEDEILAELAELNEHHFPELNLLHADLGLRLVRQYGGLVKQGRALDQLHVQPLPGTSKRTVHKVVFCGKDCVLKEYIVDDMLGIRKPEFLKRAYFYNEIKNSHILPIDALFFTGAGRQAYVQLPYYDKNLSDLVEDGPVSIECAYHILYKVLVGLQAIHAANLVFGAIHPNNVLINNNNPQSVVLAELDFSKPPHQRGGSFTTKSQLCFQPPEFKKNEISWASDMYNLGLLALWLHFPSYQFTLRSNRVPDFSPLEMDRSLEQLLLSLLQDEPATRHMASSTWQLPYFANSPHSRPNSPRPAPEEQTLQLRPKADSRPGPKNGGILKNKGSTSPTSSPVLVSPPSPQRALSEEPDCEGDVLTTKAQQADTVDLQVDSTPAMDLEPVQPDSDCVEEKQNRETSQEDLLTDRYVNEESAGSTPVLINSPQGTPVNTPVERQSECSSPPEGHPHDDSNRVAATTGLVKTAMLQCASLEITNGLDTVQDEVSDLFAEIAAKTEAILAAREAT